MRWLTTQTHCPSTTFIVALLGIGSLLPLQAQEPQGAGGDIAAQINAANALVRQGAYAAAVEEYQRLREGAANTTADTLNYNLAVAQYRNGDIERAQELFAQTALSSDRRLAASSRYNLGNCQYASALQAVESDRSATKGLLRSAIDHYRSSLRLNSDNPDARANIELAVGLLRQLEDEEKQQQQDQPQQQNQNQQSDQQEQQGDQQDNQEQQSKQDEQTPSAESQTSQDENSKQDERSGENSDQQDPSTPSDEQPSPEQQQPEQQQPEQQSTEQTPTESNDQPRRDTTDSGEQTDESETTAADDDSQPQEQQTAPTGELTADEQEENAADRQRSAAAATEAAKGKPMTREEALKMLQAVRDRDMLRRLRQERLERARRIEVEKDW